MAIVLSQLIAEFGAYYREGNKNTRDIQTQFFVPYGTSKVFDDQRKTNDTQLTGSSVTQTAVVQGFQKDFTPYGDTVFAGKKIDMHDLKVDLSWFPHDIEATYIGYLASSGLDYKDYPIVKYIVEKLVVPKIQEDIELNGIFWGVKAAVTPGTPQPIAQAMNGIKKVLNIGTAAGTIVPIALGAVPTDPVLFVDYIEAMIAEIPEIVVPYIEHLNMSTKLRNRYRVGVRKKYNVNYDQKSDLTSVIDYEHVNVEGHLSHAGSNIIWTTIKGNAVEGTKKFSNAGIIKLEEEKRVVNGLSDFRKGIGYWNDKYVFRNDVELV